MTQDREELKRLAEAATQGEWGVEDPMDHCLTIVSNPADPVYDWKWIATCEWPDEDDHLVTSREVKANAAFIAAANPAAILSLLSDLEARDAEIESLRHMAEVSNAMFLQGQERLDAMQEALKPFATVARLIDGPFGPDAPTPDAGTFQSGCAWTDLSGAKRTLTWGDFRRARQALSKEPEA